jgi:hypothetical protein
MNTGENLLFLGSHNLAPAQNVRLRPSFQQRVLEKIKLFATAGWPHHFPVVVRALPGMTETVEGVVRYTEIALKGVCATTVDGHHRHEAILMLEHIKVGPNTLAAHSEDNDKWLMPSISLQPDCPDADCRSIAWALTDQQKLSRAINSVDMLHAVNCSIEGRKQKGQRTALADLESEMNLVSLEVVSDVGTKELEKAYLLVKALSRTLDDEATTPLQEVMRLACQNHTAVFKELKQMNGIENNVESSALEDGATCFIPKFGSGKNTGGGFVPIGNKQNILHGKTNVQVAIAIMRWAYAYWIVTGGLYPSRLQYEGLWGGQQATPDAKASSQKQDFLLIKTFSLQAELTPETVMALEVLAFHGKRDQLHDFLLH